MTSHCPRDSKQKTKNKTKQMSGQNDQTIHLTQKLVIYFLDNLIVLSDILILLYQGRTGPLYTFSDTFCLWNITIDARKRVFHKQNVSENIHNDPVLP